MDPHAYDGEAEKRSIQQMSGWSRFKYFGAQIGVIFGIILFGLYGRFEPNELLSTITLLLSIIISSTATFLIIYLIQKIWEYKKNN